MFTIFRRHGTRCAHKSRRYRRCACPIWIEGSIGDEKVRRQSLNLTSWEAAEEYVRESNRAGKLGGTVFKQTTIAEAVDLYLQDVIARVRASTVRLHRVLLKDHFLPWCASGGFLYLKQIDVKAMIAFRGSWRYAPASIRRRRSRLRMKR